MSGINNVPLRQPTDTILTTNGDENQNKDMPSKDPPFTRAKARALRQGLPALSGSKPIYKPALNKKRGRKSGFTIFKDADSLDEEGQGPPKRPRAGTRTPLFTRLDSANSTPAPSPRLPPTPFPLSDEDPFWLDKENYDTHALPESPYTPPPPLPTPPPVAADPPSPPRLRRSTRIQRPRYRYNHRVTPLPLPPPLNTVLYNLLGLGNWDATVDEIKIAYRATVVVTHPDKVPEDQREAATVKMQKINGAKEVLLDENRRRQYHRDGELPWEHR